MIDCAWERSGPRWAERPITRHPPPAGRVGPTNLVGGGAPVALRRAAGPRGPAVFWGCGASWQGGRGGSGSTPPPLLTPPSLAMRVDKRSLKGKDARDMHGSCLCVATFVRAHGRGLDMERELEDDQGREPRVTIARHDTLLPGSATLVAIAARPTRLSSTLSGPWLPLLDRAAVRSHAHARSAGKNRNPRGLLFRSVLFK